MLCWVVLLSWRELFVEVIMCYKGCFDLMVVLRSDCMSFCLRLCGGVLMIWSNVILFFG